MKTKIALQYKNAVVLNATHNSNNDNKKFVVTFASELMQLGFMPTSKFLNLLGRESQNTIIKIYQETLTELKKMKGADVKYVPFYPNFPQQVMEMEEVELLINAIFHYWSFGQWRPDFAVLPRPVDFENVEFKTIDVINEQEFLSIFTQLLSSKDSISERDKNTISWFMNNYPDRVTFPKEIPFKENLCYVAGIFFEQNRDVAPLIKTTTDVLRVATYLSGGDVSLATNTKFKSLSRFQRKALIRILEKVATEEDINRHRNKWIKLFHNLHVGDYSARLFNMAKKFRNNEKVTTFNGKVQNAIDTGNINRAVKLLITRPGEFTRRLDHLIRISNNKKTFVVDNFLKVVNQVPTRNLTQLYGNLKIRNDDVKKRVVFPKGSLAKSTIVQTPLPKMSVRITNMIKAGIETVLIERFNALSDLGNVWIDPDLKGCPLPTQQRSASNGLLQVARGTRLPVGDKDTLRFFIYWIGRDIDLSATFHDEKFETIQQISYTNLKSSRYKAYHSGDITSAPNGASEFIDIDIPSAVEYGARYVSMSVNVYCGPSFAKHKKCYAGWMTRNKPNSNEIYEPKTVQQKIDLTSESSFAIPVFFDLVERKAIWTDLQNKSLYHRGGNNVHSNKASTMETLEAITSLDNKMSLFDLFMLHAHARGTLVTDKKDADTVFSTYEGTTPYDITTINSEYLI